jgi:WD40 repeat protein
LWNIESGRSLHEYDIYLSSASSTFESSIGGSSVAELRSATTAVGNINSGISGSVGSSLLASGRDFNQSAGVLFDSGDIAHTAASLGAVTCVPTNVTTSVGGSNLVVTSSSDGSFRIWDVRAERAMVAFAPAVHGEHGPVGGCSTALLVPSDESLVLSAGADKCVKLWDRRSSFKTPRTVIRCSSAVNRVALSPNHSLLAIPQDNRKTKICNLAGKKLASVPSEHQSTGHKHTINACAWSADESVLFTASFDRVVYGWCEPRATSASASLSSSASLTGGGGGGGGSGVSTASSSNVVASLSTNE